MLTLKLSEEPKGVGVLQVDGLELGQEALVQLSLTGAANVEVLAGGKEGEELEFFSTSRLSVSHQLVWLMTNSGMARLLFKVNKGRGSEFNLAVREVRIVSTIQEYRLQENPLKTPEYEASEPPGGPESPEVSPGALGAG